MSAKRFVDTNILLYAKDASETEKQPIAAALIQELWETRSGCLSTQVLNEYYVNATQKLKPGLTQVEAWADLEALQAWEPIPIGFNLLAKGFNIQSRYQLSWWDSLIVAAAVDSNCKEILSEDLASGQVYDGVPVINPFVS
ncbi:MAG: PIN domain-containing protein [Puniceicoccaceae bacterium]|nr:MAG: PIN domain-containing protein [Puniceicoccaceae bacterium]